MFLVLVLLALLSCANSFPSPGKELIYDYSARIRVGTYEPKSFASQFILEGTMHLQYENERSLLLRLSNLSYKLYNGELNCRNEFESQSLPLPEETVDLLRIFRIEYDEDGKLNQLTTEAGEHKYARNIKKAIASLLQLDRKKLKLDMRTPYAFITEEKSIYGRGLEEYNVLPQEEQIIVQKMRDVKTSRRWYSYLGYNVEAQINEGFNSPVSINSHRQYTLKKQENNLQIQRLESHGGIYFHLLKGLSDSQYLSVNQTLNLLEEIPIDQKYVINSEDRTNQIEFRFDQDTESGAVSDLSFGRHRTKQEDYIQLITQALDDAETYLEANKLEIETPDARKSQSINRLHRLMSQLTVPTLEQLYNTLNERNTNSRDRQILRIYQQMLPLIGSRATVIFIRNLIRKNKIDDDLKIDLLNKMPFYLRMRNEKVLEEVEDLLNLGPEFSLEVRRAAILCFSSLVHYVYGHGRHNHEHRHMEEQEHMLYHYPGNWNRKRERNDEERLNQANRVLPENQNQERNKLERYIQKFANLLEKSQDYQSQYLYMLALYNIQAGDISKYLEPYVLGTAPNSNRRLQFLAISASFANDLNDPERVYRIYWPIFTNRELDLDIRTVAYTMIMSTRPTMGKLWNIYWFMQTEQRPELYNYFYTHLRSLADSKNPILDEFRTNALQILKYVRKPNRNYVSGYYIIDYKDPEYDFGGILQSMLMMTNTTSTFFIDITNQFMNVPMQLYSIYLKIDGLNPALLEKMKGDRINRLNIAELDQLLRVFSSLNENQNVDIEYALMQHNQVVQLGYYNKNNMKELIDRLQNLQLENMKLLQSALNIQYNLIWQLVLPNDLGLPTVLQIKSPRISNNIFNITREIVNKITNIHADFKLQLSMPTNNDLGFYNPIPDVWQGIQRVNSYDQVIPVNLNLAINSQQQSLKLTINRNLDPQKGTIGLRSHVRSFTYVFGDKRTNYLRQSNQKCNFIEDVSRQKENRRTLNILNLEDENTGRRYEIKSFDTERSISRRSVMELLNKILQRDNKNYQGSPLVRFLLTMRNLWSRIVLLPGTGTSGLMMRALPSTIQPVSQIDLSLRYNSERLKEENALLPSTKINTRATYSLKSTGDKLLKTWDINAILDLNPGLLSNNLKLQISKIVPGEKDLKICIDGIKKWVDDGVSGHLSIAIGRSADSKCVKDEALIDINMKGERIIDESNQQQLSEDCALVHTYNPDLLQSKRSQRPQLYNNNCLRRSSNIRNYIYDIKTSKIPENMLQRFRELLQTFSNNYIPYYLREQSRNEIEENNIRILANYSEQNGDYDLEILRPEETYRISGLRNLEMPLLQCQLQPDNFHFSKKFILLQQMGLLKTCLINQQMLSNDWVEYLRDSRDDTTFNIAAKTSEQNNKMRLRITLQDQILEITPENEQYQILLNGNQISLDKPYKQEAWFSIGLLQDLNQSLLLRIYNYELYIGFNGSNAKLDVSRFGSSLIGKCYGY